MSSALRVRRGSTGRADGIRRIVVMTMLWILGGCLSADTVDPSPTRPTPPMPVYVREYLDGILDYMQARHVRRREIDWPALRRRVLEQAGDAQSIAELRSAIREALARLNDGHSAYLPVRSPAIRVNTRFCYGEPVTALPGLPATIGYVRVGRVDPGSTIESNVAVVDSLQALIRAQDHDSVRGWIVDLRGNSGGNMWPMLAGIAPLLGDGTAGFFMFADTTRPFGVHDGAASFDRFRMIGATVPYRVRREGPRIAVLTDNLVASAGEALLVALRGRAGTRVFGATTCGLSTANIDTMLSDSAHLLVTTATLADRTGRVYGDTIPPDEYVVGIVPPAERAIQWLLSRGASQTANPQTKGSRLHLERGVSP